MQSDFYAGKHSVLELTVMQGGSQIRNSKLPDYKSERAIGAIDKILYQKSFPESGEDLGGVKPEQRIKNNEF